MPQQRRKVGELQEYPDSYAWPIYEVLCPDCNQWSAEYGNVQSNVDGEWHDLCDECGNKVEFPVQE